MVIENPLWLGVGMHGNNPAYGREKQMDFHEFKINLVVYIKSSRSATAT